MKRLFNPPRPLPPTFLSATTLAFILKHAELTDEVFSNAITLPISLCLCPLVQIKNRPPSLDHRYGKITKGLSPLLTNTYQAVGATACHFSKVSPNPVVPRLLACHKAPDDWKSFSLSVL
jgi:hypothetical protein